MQFHQSMLSNNNQQRNVYYYCVCFPHNRLCSDNSNSTFRLVKTVVLVDKINASCAFSWRSLFLLHSTQSQNFTEPWTKRRNRTQNLTSPVLCMPNNPDLFAGFERNITSRAETTLYINQIVDLKKQTNKKNKLAKIPKSHQQRLCKYEYLLVLTLLWLKGNILVLECRSNKTCHLRAFTIILYWH